MEEETAQDIVCECPAIKSIRVRLYGKPLLLPEEVMEEPVWKIHRIASETGLLNLETEVVQWAKLKCQVS